MINIIWFKTVCLSFTVHSAVCLTTCPQPLSKTVRHSMRSSASSFNWQYPLLYVRPSSSYLRLLPLLPISLNLPFVFPLIICFRSQILHKMRPIQLACLLFSACRIHLSPWLSAIPLHFSHHLQGTISLAGIWKQNPACEYRKLIQSKVIRVQVLKSASTVSAPCSQPVNL